VFISSALHVDVQYVVWDCDCEMEYEGNAAEPGSRASGLFRSGALRHGCGICSNCKTLTRKPKVVNIAREKETMFLLPALLRKQVLGDGET
jgi:hypothetical protein